MLDSDGFSSYTWNSGVVCVCVDKKMSAGPKSTHSGQSVVDGCVGSFWPAELISYCRRLSGSTLRCTLANAHAHLHVNYTRGPLFRLKEFFLSQPPLTLKTSDRRLSPKSRRLFSGGANDVLSRRTFPPLFFFFPRDEKLKADFRTVVSVRLDWCAAFLLTLSLSLSLPLCLLLLCLSLPLLIAPSLFKILHFR